MKEEKNRSNKIISASLADYRIWPQRELSICIDLDGTLTEPNYWLAAANAWFRMDLKPEAVTIYSIPKLLGISETDYKDFYNQWGETLHADSRIRDQAASIVRQLARTHQIHYVSARERKMTAVSRAWLIQHGLPTESLHLLGTHEKVAKARALHCDLFIEDCFDNAVMLAAAGFPVLLIDCTYNQGVLPPGVTRVKNWREIQSFIDSFGYNRLINPFHDLIGVLHAP